MRLVEQTSGRLSESLRSIVPESMVPLDNRGKHDWKWFSSLGLERYARWKIMSEGILTKSDLRDTDGKLYRILLKREVMDALGLVQKRRNWAGMERDKLVAHAKVFIAEKEITGRKELADADAGLYLALNSRKLLGEVGLPNPRGEYRDWAGMGRDELISLAKGFISERGITGRKELAKADSGLYWILGNRGLLDELALPSSQSGYRDWAGMGRDELIAFAKKYIKERGIGGRKELAKADQGLYGALRKMGLLDEIGLVRKKRDWNGKTKQELVAFAKGFISERGIGSRKELQREDLGLYFSLFRRKLLDAVFSDVESSNHKESVDGVLSALESFGDDG